MGSEPEDPAAFPTPEEATHPPQDDWVAFAGVAEPRLVPPGAQAALDWLATMTALVDPQGRMVHANPAMEAALGLSRRHLLGRDL